MTMQITDEQVRAIVAKSILDALPQEQRENMLEKAIVSNITPPKDNGHNYYGSKKSSDLEDQFQMAAREQVRDIVRGLVEKDEAVKGRIREVVSAALTKALASDKLVDTLADGILEAFTVRER